MFARRRALVVASRLAIARPRAVAPFVRYSTESTSPSTSTSTTTPTTPTPLSSAPTSPPAQSSSEKPATTDNGSASDAAPSETPSSTPPQAFEGFSKVDADAAASMTKTSKAPNASLPKSTKTPVSRLRKVPPPKVAARPAAKPAPKPATKAASGPASRIVPTPTELPAPSNARYSPTLPPSDTAGTFNHVPINAPASVSDVQAAGQLPDINWEKSFYGASAQPVTEEQFNILMRPLKVGDIEIKPDGVIYLPEIKYRRRLNEAFGPMGWCLIPRGEPVVGESIVTREYALIINGRFVAQSQGENNYFGTDQLPSAVEGCKSNALMRCCKDLGIASELWDPIYLRWFKKTFMREVWVEHQVTKKRRTLWFHNNQVEVSYPYKLV